jgi:glycosyltransferase involved in cell wall biosynthesis
VTGAEKPRLLYLLPRYDAESPEHIYHLYGFLMKLRERIPMEILVERASGPFPKDLPMRRLRIRFPAIRLIEEVARFFLARIGGIRIFYVHYSYTGAIAASLVARLTGGIAYYWNCSMYRKFLPGPGASWRERLQSNTNRSLLELSVRLATYLVTGTPRMAEYYAEHAGIPGKKIRVLPNFVDLRRFQGGDRISARQALHIDDSRRIVLFLHRVAPRKGAQYLPDIAARLGAQSGPLTFLVAGDGPYLTVLRNLVRQEGMESVFDFRGWVPNREVPAYFRAADLYIMPSEEEGFPRVLLEAMAGGCPFVAYDVGGVRDILSPEQMDCVVEYRDLDAFAGRCTRILTDPALADSLRRAGREQVKLFSEERVLEAFVRMVEGGMPDWKVFSRAGGAQ